LISLYSTMNFSVTPSSYEYSGKASRKLLLRTIRCFVLLPSTIETSALLLKQYNSFQHPITEGTEGSIWLCHLHCDRYVYVMVYTDRYVYIMVHTYRYVYVMVHTDRYVYVMVHTDPEVITFLFCIAFSVPADKFLVNCE